MVRLDGMGLTVFCRFFSFTICDGTRLCIKVYLLAQRVSELAFRRNNSLHYRVSFSSVGVLLFRLYL